MTWEGVVIGDATTTLTTGRLEIGGVAVTTTVRRPHRTEEEEGEGISTTDEGEI